jgi:hypothetical protein
VLTTRDAALLKRAGAPPERVHHLPNPGAAGWPVPGPPPADGGRLYPTRAIRRKNLGEFLLWAAMRAARTALGHHAGAAQPGRSGRRLTSAGSISHSARRLPVDFAVGERDAGTAASPLASPGPPR